MPRTKATTKPAPKIFMIIQKPAKKEASVLRPDRLASAHVMAAPNMRPLMGRSAPCPPKAASLKYNPLRINATETKPYVSMVAGTIISDGIAVLEITRKMTWPIKPINPPTRKPFTILLIIAFTPLSKKIFCINTNVSTKTSFRL